MKCNFDGCFFATLRYRGGVKVCTVYLSYNNKLIELWEDSLQILCIFKNARYTKAVDYRNHLLGEIGDLTKTIKPRLLEGRLGVYMFTPDMLDLCLNELTDDYGSLDKENYVVDGLISVIDEMSIKTGIYVRDVEVEDNE